MTGQSRQRSNKNRSSLGAGRSSKNRNAIKKDIRSNSNKVKELKQEISDLKMKYQENNNMLLQSKVDKLEQENKKLSKQNKSLRAQIGDYESSNSDDYSSDDDESGDSDESDDSNRPVKRQKRKNSSDDEEKKAKVLLKTLLKTFPPELQLRDEETYRSETNDKICQKLIPRLQKEMKPYNPTYEQVDTWLQSIHKSKRNAYLKSNQFNLNDFGFGFLYQNYQKPEKPERPIRLVKRQTKSKGSKSNNFSDGEIDEGAKSLMKALLKTYPYEYTLSIEETFRSRVNIDICDRLIPKLQRDVRPAHDLSYGQVETWLQNFHRNKRNAYLRSNFMMIDNY
ncbi:hypothetical protein RclHR1_06830003 [Rhizophagus clarus]|uniref:Uncharacterized protein n=1 Tax=Rhizophagus clarus TaxID=94130 RepID=A0A2Z6S6K5_9GLOM|nr:hypothetical protein RclHR1_06830003 [Rhizophagus clarus]GES76117.1 hypothetical protein GLOIN_2v1667529 [Rhizophagus clarus]